MTAPTTKPTLRLPEPGAAYWVSIRAPHMPVHRLIGWEGDQAVVCDPEHPYRPGRPGHAVGITYLTHAEALWCRKCCGDQVSGGVVVTTYELRWLNGTVERITCRYIDTQQPGVMHFIQNHEDGPVYLLTVANAEIHSVRVVADAEVVAS